MSKTKTELVEVPSRLLTSVVEYLYADEKKDWAASGKPKGHIFEVVKQLDKLVKGKEGKNGK